MKLDSNIKAALNKHNNVNHGAVLEG